MLMQRIKWLFQRLKNGEFGGLFVDVAVRAYKGVYFIVYHLVRWLRGQPRPPAGRTIRLQTDFPVAFESLDHQKPWGTANDNSTNKKFVLHMDRLVTTNLRPDERRFLDLGCSGGQLVKDFLDLGWTGVGLEGSDYSLKHRRANWATLANKNLFTCDITKPFRITFDGQPAQFHLITSWEVLEHISEPDLERVFRNVADHLEPGGYFIASTCPFPDVHDGVDLHQTKWPIQKWRDWIDRVSGEFEHVDVGLKFYQFVRFTYEEPSFIVCRKKARSAVGVAGARLGN